MGIKFLGMLAFLSVCAAPVFAATDISSHKIQMIAVDKNVRLEVLDWGGSGKPLVFLPGLGADAHVFDKFAPRFTGKYHVFGITRRGFGQSDKPDATVANYAANRLGDDVLAVMDVLKLPRPVLAGWSIAGSELSSIGTRRPEKIAGLVYLDAAYAYGFYAPGNVDPVPANLSIHVNEMQARIARMSNVSPKEAVQQVDEILKMLPNLETDLRATRKVYDQLPPPKKPPQNRPMTAADAVNMALAKYGPVATPVLAIFALPNKSQNEMWNRLDAELVARFTAGNPKAKIVTIANGEHDIFNSDPDQVERDMKTFIEGLH